MVSVDFWKNSKGTNFTINSKFFLAGSSLLVLPAMLFICCLLFLEAPESQIPLPDIPQPTLNFGVMKDLCIVSMISIRSYFQTFIIQNNEGSPYTYLLIICHWNWMWVMQIKDYLNFLLLFPTLIINFIIMILDHVIGHVAGALFWKNIGWQLFHYLMYIFFCI